jgi:hypothetical protein
MASVTQQSSRSQNPLVMGTPLQWLGMTHTVSSSDIASPATCSKHTDTVHELLARRRSVQAKFDAGQKPHFLPHTRNVCPTTPRAAVSPASGFDSMHLHAQGHSAESRLQGGGWKNIP